MRDPARAFVVCSPQPRLGATMTARLLLEWFAYTGRAAIGFETDPHEGPLGALLPDRVVTADLANVQGQIALFDGLLIGGEAVRVVDVWSRTLRQFLDLARTFEFFDEAAARGLEPWIVLHADGGEASRRLADDVLTLWPHANLLFVEIEGATPDTERLPIVEEWPNASSLLIPRLDPFMLRVLGAPGFSLGDFLREPPADMSIVVRASLRHWALRVFDQLRAFEMRQALRGSEYLR